MELSTKETTGEPWRRVENVLCVECPECLFTFAAEHTSGDSDSYSCPNCDDGAPCVSYAALQAERDALLQTLETRAEREMEMIAGICEGNDVLANALRDMLRTFDRDLGPGTIGRRVCDNALAALAANAAKVK